jgi:hypothetical protein
MLDIRPSKRKLFLTLSIFAAFVILSFYISGHILLPSIALALALIISALNLRNKIILDNQRLTSITSFGKRSILIDKIGSIKLRAGTGKSSGVSIVFNEKEEAAKPLCIPGTALYEQSDLAKLLNEVVQLNPSIILSEQTKNFIEGKFYVVTGFKDA